MIGISERGKLGTKRPLQVDDVVDGNTLAMKAITILYPGESSGMVPVKPRISKRWRDGHESNSDKKMKTQQTQLRV